MPTISQSKPPSYFIEEDFFLISANQNTLLVMMDISNFESIANTQTQRRLIV